MEVGVPVAGRLRELERNTTDPHGLTAVRITPEKRLFVPRATAGGALAWGTTEEFTLELAVLPDHACGAPAREAKHQPQGVQTLRSSI
jgi:hypothetical protein